MKGLISKVDLIAVLKSAGFELSVYRFADETFYSAIRNDVKHTITPPITGRWGFGSADLCVFFESARLVKGSIELIRGGETVAYITK